MLRAERLPVVGAKSNPVPYYFFEVTVDCGHFERTQDAFAFVKNRQAMLITSLLKALLI